MSRIQNQQRVCEKILCLHAPEKLVARSVMFGPQPGYPEQRGDAQQQDYYQDCACPAVSGRSKAYLFGMLEHWHRRSSRGLYGPLQERVNQAYPAVASRTITA